ncbi:precorrin-4 C(11)-methyltransferase [Millisia brevis]|uniref:precorrin-4 C(11)-methyltransferase n=1 Tax=Millisia brevis TaxID=264148 RepID=UPI000829D3A6|nr:precorrin-4 C(11)-methyltransferase [Millisia brevis]
MTVHFVGAGPGAPDLLTLRAVELLRRTPVCVYAGSLVPAEVLAHCPPDARLVDTAHLTLDAIIDQLAAAHAAGHDVVRLHSGDPSLYSAVAEQARRLRALDIPFRMVPGVPAFAAAAAALDTELTVPAVTQSVVLTRVSTVSTPLPSGERLVDFARTGALLAVHLGAHRITEVVAEVIGVLGGDCPAAVVAFASQPGERVLRAPLERIAADTVAAGITKTAVIFIGRSLAAEEFPDSYLYSAARERKWRSS